MIVGLALREGRPTTRSSRRGEREREKDRGPGSVLNFSTIPEAVHGDHKLRFIAEPAPPLHGLSCAYVSTLQLLFTFSPVMEFRTGSGSRDSRNDEF